MQRYVTVLTTVAVTTVILGMAGLTHANDERVLNVYNWDDYLDDATIPEFEAKFGVKVNYDVYDSNETLLAKLQAGASGFDVIFPSDYMVEIMIQMGLLEPLDKTQIPNLALLDPMFLNQPFDPANAYSVPFTWGTCGIGYRADKISAPPDSWAVMFDPQYAGRIVMLDDSRETLGAALKYLGYSLNSTNQAELEQAKELLLKQKPMVKAYVSGQGEQLLISGEGWLVQNWNGDILRATQENPNIQYALPKEGSSFFIDACAIPKTAQNKALAHQFINFILQPEVDARIHNQIRYLTPNQAALPLLDEALRATIEQVTPVVREKLEAIHDLGENTRLWDKIWTEIKAQ